MTELQRVESETPRFAIIPPVDHLKQCRSARAKAQGALQGGAVYLEHCADEARGAAVQVRMEEVRAAEERVGKAASRMGTLVMVLRGAWLVVLIATGVALYLYLDHQAVQARAVEAARLAKEKARFEEATRIAAEKEAARIAAEKEAARMAADKEAARIAAEKEAARIAAEGAKARRLEWTGAAMRRAGFDEARITRTLTQGGTLVAWGYNVFGQTTVPAGLSGVTAIAAGEDHTVALKLD
jgi:hypothetical protein